MAQLPARGRVTSSRGMRTLDDATAYHAGWDIAGRAGDVVRAPERGVVVARWVDNVTRPYRGYGPAGVVVAGDSGFYHLLGHLRVDGLAELGDELAEGMAVGTMSGLNHVHWEVRTQPALTYGKTNEDITVDPGQWLTAHAPDAAVVDPPPAPPTTRADGSDIALLLLALAIIWEHT